MLISVFSFFVSVPGFTTVVLVSFFSVGGFTTVVLFSFVSAGGFVTVVSFCSHAANNARPMSRQIYFFIKMIRISTPSLPCPCTSPSLKHKRYMGVLYLRFSCLIVVTTTRCNGLIRFMILGGEIDVTMCCYFFGDRAGRGDF